GAPEGFGARHIRPSATLRYGFLHSAGFTESGLTAGELSAGARTTHILDMRLQATMPVKVGLPDMKVEVRGGFDGRATLGGNFDATLAGVSLGESGPGGDTFAAGAFVGADLSRAINGTTSFFASTELGSGSGTAFRADIRAGVKGTF
ncbi:MAG: autotransporter domain-containing protein, partial [Oricola sp.]